MLHQTRPAQWILDIPERPNEHMLVLTGHTVQAPAQKRVHAEARPAPLLICKQDSNHGAPFPNALSQEHGKPNERKIGEK